MLDFGFHNMDCMDGMKEFPDGYFDLSIVDPPYGIGADNFNCGNGAKKDAGSYGTAVRVRKNRLNQGGGTLKGRVLNNSDCSWDTEPPTQEYFDELRRVSKNQIIWGGNYFNLPPTRGIVIWDKKQPWENFSQVEMAWTSFDTPAKIFRMSNTYHGKIHPCQKPTELYRWLLERFAKPGMVILDTHVGSASSLIACKQLGYKFVGFEKDKYYYDEAMKRFEQETAQVTLFDFVGENK